MIISRLEVALLCFADHGDKIKSRNPSAKLSLYYSRWFFFSDSPRQMQFAEVNQKRKITESKKRKSLARGLSDLILLSQWSAKQSHKTSSQDTIFLNCEPHWVQGKRILNLAEIGFFSPLVSQFWKPCITSAIKNPFVTHGNFWTLFSWCELKLFHWWFLLTLVNAQGFKNWLTRGKKKSNFS